MREKNEPKRDCVSFFLSFLAAVEYVTIFWLAFMQMRHRLKKKYRKDTKYRQRIDVLDEWLKALGVAFNCLLPVLLLC